VPEPLRLDEVVAAAKTPPTVPRGVPPPLPVTMLPNELRAYVDRAKAETSDEAASYFLQAIMIAIENLSGGNKLAAGRAIDDALTHFLADLKAEIGDVYASNAAQLLITNVALFLAPDKRDMVLAALDAQRAA
jgi:hypothetical protein